MNGKKKLRVGYVGSPELFLRGASPIHVMKMCQAMGNMGIDVDLILQSYDKNIDIFECYGVKPNFNIITTIPSTNGSARHLIHGIYSAFYIWLKKRNYDVILTRNIVFTYLSTIFFKIPTIYDAHHPLVNSTAVRAFNSFKNSRYLIRFSTNSKGLGDNYINFGLPKEKLVVAHNGVDLERFENNTSKIEARRNLGLNSDIMIVCYSGNIYGGRGIELLLDTAEKLPAVLFLIVGGLEKDIESYKKIAIERKVSNFRFVGFVPHNMVSKYLSCSDVLVIPYTSSMTIQGGTNAIEFTSPIKLFEYMATGRPIVATKLPTIQEILTDKVDSVLVEPDSACELKRGIELLLDDEKFASAISTKAYRDVKKYTWEERVKKILNGISGFSA